MGTLLVGIVIEFIILIGCLAFGYTLGIYFPYKNDTENIKNKNEIIDELIISLKRMKK